MNMLKRINYILSMMLLMCPGIIRVGGNMGGGLPRFTYSGPYTLVDDGHGNWRIRFLGSGTLIFLRDTVLDVFLVGGGGGGGPEGSGSGGGGSGYTGTWTILANAGVSYSILVGAGADRTGTGGTTSAFVHAVAGGYGTSSNNGASGGSGGRGEGGVGGTDGGNGTATGGYSAGSGQGSTTREFGESSGALYAHGGDWIGKDGVYVQPTNSGNGGQGASAAPYGRGADGIVVIRNHRAA